MRLSTFALTTAIALSLSQFAHAGTVVSGDLNAGYAYATGGGVSLNEFGGGGDLLVAFSNPGFDVELGGDDLDLTGSGQSLNTWSADANLFWRSRMGSFGASVAHGSLAFGPATASVTSYGAFGEWYASRNATLRLKGGAFSGFGTGEFGGIGGEVYLMPDFGIDAEYDYTSIKGGSRSRGLIGLDYQISNRVPLSISGNYQYSTISGGGSSNTFGIALKYRFGVRGTLVDLDRTGSTVWNGFLSL